MSLYFNFDETRKDFYCIESFAKGFFVFEIIYLFKNYLF